jgi:2-oxoglutarate decarboxylase
VIFTQGKVHYDLAEHRENKGITDTALLRIEQLHPLPVEQMRAPSRSTPRRNGTSGCRRSR